MTRGIVLAVSEHWPVALSAFVLVVVARGRDWRRSGVDGVPVQLVVGSVAKANQIALAHQAATSDRTG